MKIKLKAFGYLQSDIMEVPEETLPEFRLVLHQQLSVIHGFNGDKSGEIKPLTTMAKFVWDGKYEAIGAGIMVRTYILEDIYKQ